MEPNGDQRLVVGFNWLTLHNQISLSLQQRSRNDQIEKDKKTKYRTLALGYNWSTDTSRVP